MVINMVIAEKSPPFGMILFVLKGVAPADTTMGDIFRASVPYLFIDCFVMAIILAFPSLVMWLPNILS
jgi:TRAP-type mannitol/chloroaromatic compound transport system permease large subunit